MANPKILFFIFGLFPLRVCSLAITFSDLQNFTQTPSYNHQVVEIRGFLYQTEKGDWVLSSEPDLKSCCVGAAEQVNKQIFLAGHLDGVQNNRIVNVRGKFFIEPQRDSARGVTQLFHLDVESILVEKTETRVWTLIALFLLVLGCVLFFLKKRK